MRDLQTGLVGLNEVEVTSGLSEGQEVLLQAWWVATFPGAALALTVLAFNLLADGLRDTFDPRAATLPRL